MDKLLNIFLVLFGFKTLHVLRRFKFFIKSPFHFLREIFVDIQKDLKFKKIFTNYLVCWTTKIWINFNRTNIRRN